MLVNNGPLTPVLKKWWINYNLFGLVRLSLTCFDTGGGLTAVLKKWWINCNLLGLVRLSLAWFEQNEFSAQKITVYKCYRNMVLISQRRVPPLIPDGLNFPYHIRLEILGLTTPSLVRVCNLRTFHEIVGPPLFFNILCYEFLCSTLKGYQSWSMFANYTFCNFKFSLLCVSVCGCQRLLDSLSHRFFSDGCVYVASC